MDADEHHLPGAIEDREQAGAEAVERMARLRSRAVMLDTQPRLLAIARRLRQRLPGDERLGDPLSTAGRAPVEVIARGVSALQPERESVARELGLAGLQLWQSLSEATGRGRGELQLALLFTDLVGFSSWALQAGDAAEVELLREVGIAVETSIQDHDGRIVKRLGDGLMATFLTVDRAVASGLAAQDALAAVEVEGYRPRMRAGIHWGRPRKLGGDYLGVDVNIAARVADSAKADQVVLSTTALDRVTLDHLRTGKPKRLKADGVPRDLRVIAVSRA